MVEWLRDVGMPAEYINKLARMFQDIKVSEDLNRRFKDHHKESAMAGERWAEQRVGGGAEGATIAGQRPWKECARRRGEWKGSGGEN